MLRILSLIIVISILSAAPARAGERCIKPASVMLLQSPDEKRLELARALKAYLHNHNRDERLATAIYKASLKTGVDFELMVLNAKMESDLGLQNVAATSTARGIFQYIEPTWLTLIRRYGGRVGYQHYADAIERAHYPGVPTIKNNNPYLKAEILALRHDPEMAAMMKAYQVQEETDVIRAMKRGAHVTATDHYIVHMLGLPLAKEFYAMKNSGSLIAVAGLNNPAMREAARLNKVFFYSGKRALTAREVYTRFEKRVSGEFKSIRNAAYDNKVPACAPQKPQVTLAKLEPLTQLCHAFPKNAELSGPFYTALKTMHPCEKFSAGQS